ncbi:hypothetical protein predicted by Glimmer/Critica [Acetobacter ghanensis]|uniref:Uncharacterized protein n=1 Tax=Acetobacter ghanensis TaxID=431306 RepID=A0A0U4YBR4_9PROT|nr:hypothetical protein predicted by Glimmer/Critica [Acetobacter ghanensis]
MLSLQQIISQHEYEFVACAMLRFSPIVSNSSAIADVSPALAPE